ncbi:MAG TPA: hypothetical protein VI039_00110 [Solirubrobacterales bacterium]
MESLQPDPARLSAALAGAEDRTAVRPAARRRWTPLAVGLACLVLGGAVAGAATGLLDPAVDSFLGGGNPPGRQLTGEDVPSWLQPAPDFNAPSEVSVVAAAGDERLYAYRQSGSLCFDYGDHVGECRSPWEWRRELEAQPLFVRGPVGESVWFGLVGAGIATVRVEYASGEPAEIEVTNGGFVADIDPARSPQRIVALDGSGEEVTSRSLAAEGR